MSWAHSGNDDAEFRAFVADNASGGGELVFGRITYELMAGYWPTPNAIKNNPIVAEGMNSMPKVLLQEYGRYYCRSARGGGAQFAGGHGRLRLHTRAATNYSLIVFPKNSLSLQARLHRRPPTVLWVAGIQRSV
jgi:hypothetical protein